MVSIINYVFYLSLYNRTVHISDGGDNLLIICMFFLLFANTTAYFSLDSTKYHKSLEKNKSSIFKDISTVFHNFAILACIIQLCIVYFFSAIFQLMGEVWQNGTAIYYISQVSEFSRPVLQNLTENYLWLTIIVGYLSILIKLAFPFCLLNKTIKPYIVVSMVLFHAGIGIGMGLLSFSLVMIMFELLVFTDAEYLGFKYKLEYRYRKIALYTRRKTRLFGAKYMTKFQIIVFFDGWCPMCQQVMKTINKMDLFNLVKSASIRNPQVLKEYQLVKEEVESKMHSKSLNAGEMKRGFESILQISTRLAPLYVFIPFLVIGKYLGLGELIYDYIAKRRMIVPVNHCDESGCEINIQRKY
ncbi:putative DCC family thiol-disulfide oxidoreductase YuxK [Alkalibacillus flavidus]|uniref:DCC family thiol-disulfide oxidoreductase YuxK n=1 Tax=Alkalibacillus flavidus TaxID=546021 RepID=A0ABV2KU63_9BACI